MFEAGDLVEYIGDDRLPYCPPKGTIGEVIKVVGDGSLWIKWPPGTSMGDRRWCHSEESVVCVRLPIAMSEECNELDDFLKEWGG